MKGINKIIFFSQGRFTARDYERFGVKQFLQKGFEVQVYDLSSIAQSTRYAQNHSRKREAFDEIIVEIVEPVEIEEHLKTNSKESTLIISVILLSRKTQVIYETVTRLNFQYAGLLLGLLPYHRNPDFLKYIVWAKKWLEHRWQFRGVKPASYMLVSGTDGWIRTQHKVGLTSKFICASSFDYRTFLLENKEIKSSEKNQAVFLDEYYPFHPDFDGKPIISSEEYYPLINRFFEHFESKYGVQVVIAGHPKADYSVENPYGGRSIVMGKTAELVRQSKCVLTHSSTAISFAVLWEKPILVLNFKKVLFHLEGKMTDKFAKILGANLIYLDEEYNHSYTLKKDLKKYRKYKRKFVKSSISIGIDCWDDLIDYLVKDS